MEAADMAEPIDPTEPNDPTAPIDKHDPTEPMHSTESIEPIDNKDPRERIDNADTGLINPACTNHRASADRPGSMTCSQSRPALPDPLPGFVRSRGQRRFGYPPTQGGIDQSRVKR
jgi:hypothetical protein